MPDLAHFVKKHFLLTALALAIALVLCWFGITVYKVQKIVNDTFNVSLARDAKTDEYLGEVVAEQKDQNTGRVITYRIKRNNGSMMERTSDSVIVFKP